MRKWGTGYLLARVNPIRLQHIVLPHSFTREMLSSFLDGINRTRYRTPQIFFKVKVV